MVGLENTESGVKARGFLSYLLKFKCLILLDICISTLEKIEEMNTTIQATRITFRSIVKRLDVLKTSLNASRSNEKFHQIWTSTYDSAKRLNIDDPVLPRQRLPPKKLDKNSNTAYFPSTPEERYKIMYFGMIDQILMSLNIRFDSENYKILCLMEDFALGYAGIESIREFLFHNGESDFDVDRLVLHKEMFLDHLKNKKVVMKDLTTISIFLQENKDVREFCSE